MSGDLDAFLKGGGMPSKEPERAEHAPSGPSDADMAAVREKMRVAQLSVTVAQFMAVLSTMPPDAEVKFLFDGFITPHASAVWLARDGRVIIAQAGDTVYRAADQPAGVESTDWEPPPFDDPARGA
jgi:hypothetical protein